MPCIVFVPVLQHRDGRDAETEERYRLPGDISAATYAMREAGIVSVPICDDRDETPRRLHVSGRIDVVAWHVGPHYRGAPDPLEPRPVEPAATDDGGILPF